MNRMTIGQKIGYGFGLVLLLLATAGLLSYQGVGSIVKNAGQVIDGNQLDGNLAQKEVDHLNWAGSVNALLTDDRIHELNVQTDPHKCAFGKWLYGPERRQAEKLVPSLAPLFKRIEAPHAQLHDSAIKIADSYHSCDLMLPGFLAEKLSDHLSWSGQVCQFLLDNGQDLTVQTDPTKCAFGQWYHSAEAQKAVAENKELAALFAAIDEPHKALHASALEIKKHYRKVHPGLEGALLRRISDHRRWAEAVAEGVMLHKSKLGVETDPTNCALGKWLNSKQASEYTASFPELKKILDGMVGSHEKLHESAISIQKELTTENWAKARQIFIDSTRPALDAVVGSLEKAVALENELVKGRQAAIAVYQDSTLSLMRKTAAILTKMKEAAEASNAGMLKARDIYAHQTMPSLAKTQRLLNDIRVEARRNIMTDQVMLSEAITTKLSVTIVSLAAIILGVILAVFIVRGVSAVLRNISGNLSAGSEQVAAAATQVASASQQLAEGASEQAASLEETSSSMEEMSSMVQSNADNSVKADELMNEAKGVIDRMGGDMAQMAESMDGIASSGREISKIVKSIDEIAFQTNLLALNAAVEAARAGEAGAGFAVVADEVRALALRAAAAANSTQELIEDTVTRINTGSELVGAAREGFAQVANAAERAAKLVQEIASSSNEQAEGITQINQALTQMDGVVQQTAASAEESASSSEELDAQARTMQGVVVELMCLIDGQKSIRPSRPALSDNTRRKPALRGKMKAIKADQVIAMDDELSDF